VAEGEERMKWLDDIGDAIGPLGCGIFLVFYTIFAIAFLATCHC
jgi:hypothetical protein